MRRENSKFNAAFVSYEGSKLFNNDYYGSAELDRFACYVVADGLEPGDIESESARIAVQAAIAAFHERPSISARAMKHYVQAAHEALKGNTGHLSLRASITVVVTNYQKARYAWAGNTRFYLYRAGRLINESIDHSLSRQMADRGELPMDKIALHEERDNLSRYAGQPDMLTPQVSKKIVLQDGDIFMLLTRGIWEQCDAGDIRATLDSAENYPQLALEYLERLLLDPHPFETDNYTAAAIFVDKVYIDPNRGRKIKRILMIAIPAFVILVGLIILLVVMHNRKVGKIHDMNTAFLSAVEYIGDDNYPRASTDLETAIKLAGEVKDRGFQAKADTYRKLVDAITNGDDLLAAGDYEEAGAAFLIARDRSRFTDNYGQSYIERKLMLANDFLIVRDLIALGDTLSANKNYAQAEAKYLDARQLAGGISDAEGRQQAIDALQNLYDQQERDMAAARDAAANQAQALQEGAEMEAAGDQAVKGADLVSAKLFYDIAYERFSALGDSESMARIDSKLRSLAGTQTQKDEQAAAAAKLVADGDKEYDQGFYVDAKVKYIQARNIYSRLQNDEKLTDVLTKIDMCDAKLSGIAAAAPNAPNAPQGAAAATQPPASAPPPAPNTAQNAGTTNNGGPG
ncbi:MAG: hypothetical protein LBH28_03995 [Oscillospiraceae bacterium]|jgi:serine/threonine protein phosphatase PrpC|nr:hypothetical protein [Oscillospiraceae bacterium]